MRGASMARGLKGSAMAAVGGAGAALIDTYALQKIEFIRKTWWARPLIYAVGGHLVKRKWNDVGAALIGVAGYQAAGYLTKDAHKDPLVEGLTQPSEVYEARGLTQPSEVYQAQGIGDMFQRQDAGELVEGAWGDSAGTDSYTRQNALQDSGDAGGLYDASDAMGL